MEYRLKALTIPRGHFRHGTQLRHAAARSHPLVAAPEAAPCRHRQRKQHKAPGTFRKRWYNVGYKND